MLSPIDAKIEEYLKGWMTPPLAAVVGARLARVIYWCSDERSPEFISNPFFETTGLVELEFSNGVDIYLTWHQNAITFGDNAVWVRADPMCVAEVYTRCEANMTPLWATLIGMSLESVEVLAWGTEVRAVKFRFGDRNVYIGVGLVLQSDDDVFVRSEIDFFRWHRANEGEVLWSAVK